MPKKTVRLEDILTLEEASTLSGELGVPLDRRHDIAKACLRSLIPAERRARSWWVTRSAIQALVERLRGLSFAERQDLYASGVDLVSSDVAGSTLSPELLFGYGEIRDFCSTHLGWSPATATLMKYAPRFDHRKAGRTIITTQRAVTKLFQAIWRNKLRVAGLPVSGGSDAATVLLRIAQMLTGQHPGAPVGDTVVQTLRQALAAAEAARTKQEEVPHGSSK